MNAVPRMLAQAADAGCVTGALVLWWLLREVRRYTSHAVLRLCLFPAQTIRPLSLCLLVIPSSAPPEPSGALCTMEPLQGTSGLFFLLSPSDTVAEQSTRQPMDSAAMRPWTNPSKPCRRASRRVVEQHSHRRDDQYYAVGMCELVGPWTVARHWLASLVSRTRQLDGDSAGPIKAVQPLGRDQGSGSGIRGCLAGKKGAARETSNIYHQGGITKLEQNRANRQKQPVETYDLLTCLPPPICKDQMETTPPCAISPHPPQPHRILGTRRRSPLISAFPSHPRNPGQHWDWASRYAESHLRKPSGSRQVAYHQATVLRLCSPRCVRSVAVAQRGLMKDTRAPSVFLRLAQT